MMMLSGTPEISFGLIEDTIRDTDPSVGLVGHGRTMQIAGGTGSPMFGLVVALAHDVD